jgi:hypothetical protein
MDSFAALSLGGTVLYAMSILPWTTLFLCTRVCGIRYYILRDGRICDHIQRKIHGRSSAVTDNDKAYGYSYGRWYCLYLQDAPESTVWIVSTQTSFEKLAVEKEETVPINGSV